MPGRLRESRGGGRRTPRQARQVNGKVVDAVDIFVGGRSGPSAKHAVKIMEDVPCDKLASVLEGLVPYDTRDKLHRTVKGKIAVKQPQAPKAALSPQTAT